jgi:F0F1-type ATP synthase membrane subunit b/b'
MNNFALLFAEGSGGFIEFYNNYLNIPGFEAWKFLNLGIFVLIMAYLLRKPLGEAFKAKRETIRAELIKAEQEKQAALERLTLAEAKLTRLSEERTNILEKAKLEADAEKRRLAEQTASDIQKLRVQAENEIARLTQLARRDLRRLSAEESVRLAEEKIRTQLNPEQDSRLIRASINEIGGLN